MRLRTSQNTKQTKASAQLLCSSLTQAKRGSAGKAVELKDGTRSEHVLLHDTSRMSSGHCAHHSTNMPTCHHAKTCSKHAQGLCQRFAQDKNNSRFQGKRKRGHTKENQFPHFDLRLQRLRRLRSQRRSLLTPSSPFVKGVRILANVVVSHRRRREQDTCRSPVGALLCNRFLVGLKMWFKRVCSRVDGGQIFSPACTIQDFAHHVLP